MFVAEGKSSTISLNNLCHGVWVPAFAGTTTEYASTFSRRDAPGVLQENLALEIRGRREDRMRAAPAVSCAMLHKNMLHMSIQVERRASGLHSTMALRLIRNRPGDPAFCDTIALGQR